MDAKEIYFRKKKSVFCNILKNEHQSTFDENHHSYPFSVDTLVLLLVVIQGIE